MPRIDHRWEGLEEDLDLQHGQFKGRSQATFSFMTKPFAAALIYPAVLAAWTYMVFFPEDSRRGKDISLWAFISGFVWIVIYDVYLKYGLYKARGFPSHPEAMTSMEAAKAIQCLRNRARQMNPPGTGAADEKSGAPTTAGSVNETHRQTSCLAPMA